MLCLIVAVLALASISSSEEVEDADVILRALERMHRFNPGLFQSRMGSAHFTYDGDGPNQWPEYPQCSGPSQSPINIDTDRLVYREISEPLEWTNYERVPGYMKMERSQYSLKVTPIWWNSRDVPYLSGGPLNRRYYFSHFHFHWNASSTTGSEHRVNNRSYPMEMHMVHNTNKDDPGNDDQYLVIGHMITLTGFDNPALRNIVDGTKRVRGRPPKSSYIWPFSMRQLRVEFCQDYVIYSGSLTTPPCTTGVIWMLSSRPLSMSIKQYHIINDVVTMSKTMDSTNIRPVQSLGERKVFYIVSPTCRNWSPGHSG